MAARSTGWAMLVSGSVQEAQDFALIAQAATLEARVPFLHFFDGFRTSHEVNKIEQLTPDDIRAMIDERLVRAHRDRALSPDRPVLRGSAQNPDVFFQAREAVNPFYDATAGDRAAGDGPVRRAWSAGSYHLFDYVGRPDAERVLVIMGSGAGAAEEAVEELVARGEKVGLVRGPALSAVLRDGLRRGAAADHTEHCRPGSHERAGRLGRAAVSGRGDRPGRVVGERGDGAGPIAAGHRRPLRAVVEGVHAGHGRGGLRRTGPGAAETALHGRYHTTT